MQFSTDGTTWSAEEAFSAFKQYTPQNQADGSRDVYVRFKDKAGNYSVAQIKDTITIDQSLPGGGVTINAGATYTQSELVTLTLSCSDAGSGCTQMQFSNDNNAWSTPEAFTTPKVWTLASEDGLKTIYARFKDNTGNWSNVITGTITLDTTAPGGTVTVNSGQAYTTNPGGSVSLTLSCTDTTSGCAQMQFSNDEANWSNLETYATNRTWTISTSGNGSKTIYARFKDTAGNLSKSFTAAIILDTTPPVGSIQINATTAYTTSRTVTLTLSCSDANQCITMEFNNDGGAWSPPEPFQTTKTWDLPLVQGLRTVNVRFSDQSGLTGTASGTITLDSVKPDAGTVNLGGTITNSPIVTLALNCTDPTGTGCNQMQFSNDGANWSPLTSYTATAVWNLTDATYGGSTTNGAKTVYSRFTDIAGNQSSTASGLITFDTVAPSPPIVNGATPTNNTKPTWTWTNGGGNGSGIFRYSLNDASLASLLGSGTQMSYTPVIALSEGPPDPLRAGAGRCRQLVPVRQLYSDDRHDPA